MPSAKRLEGRLEAAIDNAVTDTMKPRIQISIPREDDADVDTIIQSPSSLQPSKWTDRSFPINEECTSLGLYHDAFVLAGFSDGTVRIFDLHDAFPSAVDTSDEMIQHSPFVNSNIYQRFGAVACQIHAKGVHTSLRLDLKIAGNHCFASVVRGSMECVAIQLDGLRNVSPQDNNILDAISVSTHADAKLRGLTHATVLPNDAYLLVTGKSIKNIHIWRCAPHDHTWECLYDTATNGNTIQWSTTIGTSVVSKSQGQCLRVWNVAAEYDAAMQRPTKLTHYDVLGTESALSVSKDWKVYSTGVFDPGHLKVHDFETDESSHLCILPQTGSRRQYASVEQVVVTEGIVMALVSDGSVWCGMNELEKIATCATACHVSRRLSVVATNDSIQCRVLPWKNDTVVSEVLASPVMTRLEETEPNKSNEEEMPVKVEADRSSVQPEVGVKQPSKTMKCTEQPEDPKTVEHTEAEVTQPVISKTVKRTKVNAVVSKRMKDSEPNFKQPVDSKHMKRNRQGMKSSDKPKKKRRILLKNILNASTDGLVNAGTNGVINTPAHRPKASIVTETKTDSAETSPITQLVPQAAETPRIWTPSEVNPKYTSPDIPRKRRNQHTCTPRKLESPAAFVEEPIGANAANDHAASAIATNKTIENKHPEKSSTFNKEPQLITNTHTTKLPSRKPFQLISSRKNAADRKHQMRVKMCRKQMRLIDKAIRQLPRSEENYIRSRILLMVRRAIQDIMFDGSTAVSQRNKLEHEILPAFRRNIVIPWQLRCELETLEPVKAFDESVFAKALGYMVAIELI